VIATTVRVLVLLFSLFVQPAFADNTTVKFKHMFVLGDSLSDQGNLFSRPTSLGKRSTFRRSPRPITTTWDASPTERSMPVFSRRSSD